MKTRATRGRKKYHTLLHSTREIPIIHSGLVCLQMLSWLGRLHKFLERFSFTSLLSATSPRRFSHAFPDVCSSVHWNSLAAGRSRVCANLHHPTGRPLAALVCSGRAVAGHERRSDSGERHATLTTIPKNTFTNVQNENLCLPTPT